MAVAEARRAIDVWRSVAVGAHVADLALYLVAPEHEANPAIVSPVVAIAVKVAVVAGTLVWTSERVLGTRYALGASLLALVAVAGATGVGSEVAVLLGS